MNKTFRMPGAIKNYCGKMRRIGGWFSPEMARLFVFTDHAQKLNGIKGNIFEIGVHQGKSAILLNFLLDPEREILSACDIFDGQDFNVSASGSGNMEIFKKNFTAFHPDKKFPTLYSKQSGKLTEEETTKYCRIFHIDGGHFAEETYEDLKIASRAIHERGVIILDDYFNAAFPGVSEGFCRFMSERKGDFVPLTHAFNKLVILRPAAFDLYAKEMESEYFKDFLLRWPYEMEKGKFFGHDIFLIFIPSYRVNPLSPYFILRHFIERYPWLKKGIKSLLSKK